MFWIQNLFGVKEFCVGNFCGSFIVSFSNHVPDPERDSAAVQEFLAKMEADFRAHPLWAGCSEEELDSAGEVSYNTILFVYTLCYVRMNSISMLCFTDPTNVESFTPK